MNALPWSLRRAEDADEDFLYRLFEATHGQQFALLPLAPQQLEALLRMQFEAQRSGYGAQRPAAQDFLILVKGEPAGRIWLDDSAPFELHLLDVALLPQYQRSGLGSAVLRQAMQQAADAGKPMCLSVARMNVPAFALYRRLGFEETGGDEIYIQMKWTP